MAELWWSIVMVSVAIHGTFGELLQGYVVDGSGFDHFLFTSPVEELRCEAKLRPGDRSTSPMAVVPPDRVKTLEACRQVLADLEHPADGSIIEICSNIPVAKGYSSSTADILAATLTCVRHAYPRIPEPVALALALSTARRVEYGDYLLHAGIAACHQRSQSLITRYHTDLRWTIVGIDEGGFVRTKEFHERWREDRGKARVYDQLFREFDHALRANDSAAAARIVTRSGELHNDVLPKKSLGTLRTIAEGLGAIGFCVAHSGTLTGAIFSRHDAEWESRIDECRSALRQQGYESSVYTLRESSAA